MADISSTLENYIEAIYNAIRRNGVARAKDLKDELNVHGASVTGALKTLSEKELINYKPYEFITLTPKGETIGKIVSGRHEVLLELMTSLLGKDERSAGESACGMEHSMDADLTERFQLLLGFITTRPDIQNDFKAYLKKKGVHHLRWHERAPNPDGSVKLPATLDSAEQGSSQTVVGVNGGEEASRRLLEMGFVPGATARVVKNSGSGPIIVSIKDSEYVLHRGMAGKVVVNG